MSITAKLKTAYSLLRLAITLVPVFIKLYHNRDEYRAMQDEVDECPDCGAYDLCDDHLAQLEELPV